MMYGYSWAWPAMLWMGVWALLCLLAFGLLLWALVRWLDHRRASGANPSVSAPATPSAQEILRQRYARGEIDAATYEQMRERLGV